MTDTLSALTHALSGVGQILLTGAEDTLLPCPFCGGGQITTAPDREFGDTTWVVICKACGSRTERDLEIDAIAAWNRRVGHLTEDTRVVRVPVLEAAIAEIGRLRAALEPLARHNSEPFTAPRHITQAHVVRARTALRSEDA